MSLATEDESLDYLSKKTRLQLGNQDIYNDGHESLHQRLESSLIFENTYLTWFLPSHNVRNIISNVPII